MRCFKTYLFVLVIPLSLFMFNSCMKEDNSALIEEHKKLAGELKQSNLYKAAVDEYEKILAFNEIDLKTRANVNYLIGKIYFEDINDYEKAAAYYVRANTLDPEGSFKEEASKNLIASLEKMGNILDARRRLSQMTDIDSKPEDSNDVKVALIGNDVIWLSEVERQIQTLSFDLQEKLRNREAKLRYINQYVGMELMFRAAERENYGDDPEIVKRQDQLYRQLLIDKYIVDKVMPQIKFDSLDVLNFYQANASERYDNKPYDSVKAQVFMDYQNEKAQAAFSSYINRLSQTEKVQILEHNVK